MSEETIVLEPQAPTLEVPLTPAIPELTLSGEQTNVLQGLIGKSPESPQNLEQNATRALFVKDIRNEMQMIQRLLKGKIDWEFSPIPSENKQAVAANRAFPQRIVEKIYPGVDFNNAEDASGITLLQGEYQRNERMIRVYKNMANTDPSQITELARLAGEQERIKGFLKEGETIDLAPIENDFNEGGILATREKQGQLLAYASQFKAQYESLSKQSQEYNGKILTSFSLAGQQIEVTKDDLKSWGANTATILALAAFLMYQEGEKENQQQQARPMGH